MTSARDGRGVSLEVGQTHSQISESAARVEELVQGIAKASGEQAEGVNQISTAVGQVDSVTQQAAASAEESASASQQLSAQAATVRGMVGELSAILYGASQSQLETEHRAG